MFLTESAGTSGPSTSVSGRLHERTPHQIDPHLPESCHVGYHRSLLSNPTSSVRCQNAKMPVQRSVQKLHPFWNRTQIYKNEVFCFEKNRDGMLEEVKCWWINKCAYISLRMYIYIYCTMNYIVLYIIISVSAKWQNADKRPCHLCFPANLPGWSCTVGTYLHLTMSSQSCEDPPYDFSFHKPNVGSVSITDFCGIEIPTLVVDFGWVQSGFLVPFSGKNRTLKTSQTNLAMGNPWSFIIFSRRYIVRWLFQPAIFT